MRMKHKPLMGTKLVPNIRNIEGCFKYGGIWDREKKVCISHESPTGGCTAPINGAQICWSADDYGEGHFGSRTEIMPWASEEFYKNSEPWNIHDETYQSEESAAEEAKNVALDCAQDLMEDNLEKWVFHLRCFNLKGRSVSCDEENAVLDVKGKNVAKAYRDLLKMRSLDEFIKSTKKTK